MNKIIVIVLTLLLFLAGCGTNIENESDEVVITTTIYPITLIVEQLAGDQVTINQVFPKGADVHSYEPTSRDMVAIADSDIVFYISDEEEPFVQAIKADDDDNTKYINISEHELFKQYVDPSYYGISQHDEHEDSHEDLVAIIDPHIWVSPKLVILMTNVIVNELDLIGIDVSTNLDVLIQQLNEVDHAYQKFSQAQTTSLVVSHNAYNYLELEYGIDFISLYGLSHDDEPSSKEIADVIDYINDNGVEKIYIDENQTNKNLMDQITSETDTQLATLLTISTESDITKDMTIVDCLNYNLLQMEN